MAAYSTIMLSKIFSKKKPVSWNGSTLQTDMHSHLLPGIDDGATDWETALGLVEGLKDLGYSRLITTPHIRQDQFPNTPDIIRRQEHLLQEAIQKKQWNISLHAAAEYFLDDHILDLLKKKEPLLTLHGQQVLVEFSLLHESPHIQKILFDLQMSGYQPVIAHPERYTYLHKRYELLHTLKDNGCLFQLNLFGAFGGYGKTATEIAQYLIGQDFYDYIGTDLHNLTQLNRLQQLTIHPMLHKLLNSNRLLNHRL